MVDRWDSPFLGPFESLWPQQLDAFPRMEAKPRCVLGISRPVSSQKPTIEDIAFYCTGKTVLISNKMLKKTTEEWKERKGRYALNWENKGALMEPWKSCREKLKSRPLITMLRKRLHELSFQVSHNCNLFHSLSLLKTKNLH